MKNKLFKVVLFTIMMLIVMNSNIYAAEVSKIDVQLNGQYIDFTDNEGNKVEPQLINSRTMVPMRKIFEVLNSTVEWNGETNTVTAENNGKTIILQINNLEAKVSENGEEQVIILDSAPVIVNDRTLVPVRFIAESLNMQVGWDEENQTVIIIDYNYVKDYLIENTSTFFEYLTTEYEQINTSEQTIDMEIELGYKDKDNKKNNSKLTMPISMKLKQTKEAVRIDIDVTVKGSGILFETLYNSKKETISMSIIIDIKNGVMYLNSSEYEKSGDVPKGKWIYKSISNEELNILGIAANEKLNPVDIILMLLKEDENFLTVDSYNQFNYKLELFSKLFGNKYFTVSGNSIKNYKWNITLENLLNIIGMEKAEVDQITDIASGNMEVQIKVNKNVPTESKIKANLLISYEETNEEVAVEFEMDAKIKSYNKPIEIVMPKKTELFDAEEDIIEGIDNIPYLDNIENMIKYLSI